MTEPITQPPANEAAGYDPAAIEHKWQTRWRERGTNSTDLAGGDRPFYALMMFPYPSAEGLHVGNLFAFMGMTSMDDSTVCEGTPSSSRSATMRSASTPRTTP